MARLRDEGRGFRTGRRLAAGRSRRACCRPHLASAWLRRQRRESESALLAGAQSCGLGWERWGRSGIAVEWLEALLTEAEVDQEELLLDRRARRAEEEVLWLDIAVHISAGRRRGGGKSQDRGAGAGAWRGSRYDMSAHPLLWKFSRIARASTAMQATISWFILRAGWQTGQSLCHGVSSGCEGGARSSVAHCWFFWFHVSHRLGPSMSMTWGDRRWICPVSLDAT